MGSYFRDYADRKASQRPTIGDTKFSAVTSDHMGWLKCDGRSLSVANYNLLFQVIGYAFGGSGTTFRLPDSQGRVPAAIGPNGESTRALGDVSGTETHTLTIAQMPSHTHTGTTDSAGNHFHTGTTDPAGSAAESELVSGTLPLNMNVSGSNSHTHTFTTNTTGAHTHTITMNNTGGDQPHNNIQPTIFMGSLYMYCGRVTVGNWPYTTNTNIL